MRSTLPGSTPNGSPAGRPSPAWRTLLESVASLVVVLGVLAVALRALDALPGVLTGNPRGVRRLVSLDDVRRVTGITPPVPPYFPDTLRWPPLEIRVAGNAAVTLLFGRRGTDDPWLLIGAARAQNGGLPAQLVDEGLTLQTSPVKVGPGPATLRRLRTPDGLLWQELSWRSGTLEFLMRYRGPLEQLETMASSLRDQQP